MFSWWINSNFPEITIKISFIQFRRRKILE